MSLKPSSPRAAQAAAQAAARLARQVALALGGLDLSPSQYRLLPFLSEGNAARAAVPGRPAGSRAGVTALADGLERRGLLQRKPDSDDRRRVAHELTDAGREALAAANAAVAERITSIAARLDDEQPDRAIDGLALWSEALNRHRAAMEAHQ